MSATARDELLRLFGERTHYPLCARCRTREGDGWFVALWVCSECVDEMLQRWVRESVARVGPKGVECERSVQSFDAGGLADGDVMDEGVST